MAGSFPGASPFTIRLFGPFEVCCAGAPLPRLRSRKGYRLLALLTLRRGAELPRSWLAGTLWPDSLPPQALGSLRITLADLRQALGPEAARLRSPTPHTLCLDLAGAEVDLVTFEEGLARGDPASLEAAIAAYRGPLLEGWAEEWLFQERHTREQGYLAALERLAEGARERGEPLAAAGYLQRAVAVDPLRESAQRALMAAWAAGGNYAASLASYRELRLLLHRELNAPPDPQTTALFEQIRQEAREKAAPYGRVPSARCRVPSEGDRVPTRHSAPGTRHSERSEGSEATLTFLFTDIEGSTRLWERHPEAMREALTRHDQLLRQAVEAHGGHLFKSMGDQVCAAFERASAALAAALAAQRALQAAAWPEIGSLRVRMALHTGAAQQREGDFFGPTLNRLARLLQVGHGGQILLSQATGDPVRGALPEGVSLCDLGEHRLRDLEQPERVWQVVSPDLPAEFPPLNSLDRPRSPLPVPLTRFIGRQAQIADVKRLLAEARLLTLTGAGGCGKTRLALQVAGELEEGYPDGVSWVELAALSDPTLVPQSVAATLGVREAPGRSLTAALIEFLRSKELLLVLDNCEHVLPACAQLAEELLQGCPRVRVLATSRERLRIAGEQTYQVPPLSSPDLRELPGALGSLTRYEALELFQDRARLSQPTFTITEQNAGAVVAVCRRLDGIPLAIELAAARVKALPVERIVEQLDDRFRLLTGGSRTALPRQQTLRALIDWSYDLLTEAERTLLRRLSVFAGGWALEAAEAICGGDGIEEWEVLGLLTQLVEKSLVAYEEQNGDGRYRLLETLRQYGRERLQESGKTQSVQERHREYYLRLAEEVGPRLIEACDQEVHLRRLETEHDNLRAALAWSTEQGDADAGLRLGKALGRFWWLRGHWAEGRERLERLLELEGASRYPAACAEVLWAAGWLAGGLGDFTASRRFQRESERIARELGDRRLLASVLSGTWHDALHQAEYGTARRASEEILALQRERGDPAGIAMALRFLALVALHQGEFPRASALSEESLAIERASGNQRGIARSLQDMGQAAMHQGDLAGARARYEESLAIWRRLGNPEHTAVTLQGLGDVAFYEGRYAEAHALSEESLAIRRKLGQLGAVAESLQRLAEVARVRGDLAGARGLYVESVQRRQRLGDRRGLVECLEGFARIAGAEGRAESAARLLGAAEAARQGMGALPSPLERAEHERVLAAACAALGETTFTSAWAQGQAMTLEEAIAFALQP